MHIFYPMSGGALFPTAPQGPRLMDGFTTLTATLSRTRTHLSHDQRQWRLENHAWIFHGLNYETKHVTSAQILFSETNQMILLHRIALGNVRKQCLISFTLSATYY